MNVLAAAAEHVRSVVEAYESERYDTMTKSELESLPNYQLTDPTAPGVGFRYRRAYWPLPGGYMTHHENHPDRIPGGRVKWIVYTVERDSEGVKWGVPREARVR